MRHNYHPPYRPSTFFWVITWTGLEKHRSRASFSSSSEKIYPDCQVGPKTDRVGGVIFRPPSSFFRLFLIGGALLLIGAAVYFTYGRKPVRVDMTRYAPADALLFAELGDLPETTAKLTETLFWKGLRPAIGFPDQLLYLESGAGFARQFDLGPDEARLLGRAQWAVVVTGVTTEGKPVVNPAPTSTTSTPKSEKKGEPGGPEKPKTGESEGTLGLELSVTPRLAVLIKSNISAGAVERLAAARLPLLAKKLFGAEPVREDTNYQQVPVLRFRAPGSSKALVAAIVGDLLVVGNDEPTLQACLDVIAARKPALADLPALASARTAVRGETATLFAFVSPAGIARLGQFGFGFLPESVMTNPSAQALVETAVKGMTDGLAYGASIEDGRVTDRYLFTLHPEAAAALRPHAATLRRPPRSLELVSGEGVTTCLVTGVKGPFEALDKTQQAISARSNIAVSFLIREVANALRAKYGLGPRDTLDDALGEEIAHVTFSDRASVWLFEVKDRVRVLPVLDRYLRTGGATISNETLDGVELVVSSHPDGRAAGFLGDFLMVGPKPVLQRLIRERGKAASGLMALFREKQGTDTAPVISFSIKNDREELELLTLAIAKISHSGDATPARLQDPAVRKVIDGQPPGIGKTELRDTGLYTETRSAAGNFALFAALIGPDEPVQPKTSSQPPVASRQ